MFQRRKLSHYTNNIHGSTLRLVYKDYNSSFDYPLVKDYSFRIHHRHLQKLAVKIFKRKQIWLQRFQIVENPYLHKNEIKFTTPKVQMVRNGIETASFGGSKIWNSIPSEVKELSFLGEIKAKY